MANRSDIRTETRDLLYETSADLWSDARLNRAINHTLRDLPRHGIYLEEVWETPLSSDLDYSLPDGAIEVEQVEVNRGTSTDPDWQEIQGWDQYAGAVYLPFLPTNTDTMRFKVRKGFSELSDDVTATDVPTTQLRLVAVGAALKCMQMLMGFFLHTENWDAIAKPDSVDMTKLANWIRQLDEMYKKELAIFRKQPKPRTIDLVG